MEKNNILALIMLFSTLCCCVKCQYGLPRSQFRLSRSASVHWDTGVISGSVAFVESCGVRYFGAKLACLYILPVEKIIWPLILCLILCIAVLSVSMVWHGLGLERVLEKSLTKNRSLCFELEVV